MNHRGRIQAQGKNVQASESWDQDQPLLAATGRAMLEQIRASLGKREGKLRGRGFEQAHRYIDPAERLGGVSPSPRAIKKSFPQPPRSDQRRVDIEVHRGQAFTPEPKTEGAANG